MAVCDLPKVETRVRFSYPAQKIVLDRCHNFLSEVRSLSRMSERPAQGNMRNIIRKLLGKEDWILRIAISFTILWAGIRGMLNPTDWVGFVPSFVKDFMDPEVFLIAYGFMWILVAAGLLAGFWRPFLAFVAFSGLTAILIFNGIDDITFRDVGLALTAFVLFLRETR